MKPTFYLFVLLALLSVSCMPKRSSSYEKGSVIFEDNFERAALGSKYVKTTGTWAVKDGALHSSGEKNVPLWLDVALPKNVEITFTAWSNSPAVDTKIEVFGDGKKHESGYIAILGGWNNQITTIARLDEHEKTRAEKRTQFEVGKKYQWTVRRLNGSDVEMLIDGKSIITYKDSSPLFGKGHDRLGFTNWQSDVYYDDLKITAR